MGHINITNRPEFAAYLNMALHNCYITLSHILKITGSNGNCFKQKDGQIVEEPLEQEYIKDACLFNVDYQPSESERNENLKKLLIKHFAMLDPFVKNENDKIISEEIAKSAAGKSDEKIKLEIDQLYPYTLEDLTKCLKKVFTVLTYYRDMASHVIFNDTRSSSTDYSKVEKEVAYMLNFTMTVACRIVKTRFSLDNGDLDFFLNNRRDKHTVNKRPNTEFSHCVFKNDGLNDKGQMILSNLSEMGLVYLICMFLEKKYARMFVEQIGKFYKICNYYPENKTPDHTEYKKLLFEIYTIYRIQVPHAKLDSTRNDFSNAMDMLNELKKCPAELYDVLSKENQSDFEVMGAEGRVLLRRYEDRFAHMALRWIDDKEIMESLRFQVRYGKLHYVFCDSKKCADGQNRVRTIVKDLNGFGRLLEVERRRRGETDNIWNGTKMIRPFEDMRPDEPNMKPYITDYNTQYILDGNKVGIYDGDYMPDITDDNKVSNEKPHYWLSLYDLPGLAFYSYLYRKLSEEDKAKFVSPQDVICKYGERYNKLFTDLRDNRLPCVVCSDPENPQEDEIACICKDYDLKWNEIPNKIKDIITGRKRNDFDIYAENEINKEKKLAKDTRKRLKRNKEAAECFKDNKMGKKNFVAIRPGSIALSLAHDIVKYQPYNMPSDKPTGLNFRVMQSMLATFSNASQLDDLNRLFNSLKLLNGGDISHPFLKEVMEKKPVNVIDFYEKYLDVKINYIESNFKKGKGKYKKPFVDSLPFLNASRSKWMEMTEENRRKLAEEYLNTPISLPTALYLPAIHNLLLSKHKEEIAYALNKGGNISYLIQQYMIAVKHDNVQNFYKFNRPNYGVNILMNMDSITEKDLSDNFQEKVRLQADNKWNEMKWLKRDEWEEKPENETYDEVFSKKVNRAVKEFKNNERTIRRYKTEDIVLFLMATDTLIEENIKTNNWLLKDIAPNAEQGILSENLPKVEFDFKLLCKEQDSGESVYYDTKIIYENLKIKDWGKMTSLLYDWRIQNRQNSLLYLLSDDEEKKSKSFTFNFAHIREELDNYDKNRVELFKKILEFETKAIELIKANPNKTQFREDEEVMFAKVLNKCFGKNPRNQEIIKGKSCVSQVRNSMCHNQYPRITDIVIKKEDMPNVMYEIEGIFDAAVNNLLAPKE